jgi:hypothetical protein
MFTATFLGHQSWLFGTATTRLLVDPVLTTAIGHDGSVGEVFPPRAIDAARFPALDGVLITHEHDDHFDIPSLNLIARSVPILLSVRSSVAARRILRDMGFAVTLVETGRRYTVGDLEVHLFTPDHRRSDSDEWDVVQFLVRDVTGHGSLFTPVDTAATMTTKEQLVKLLARPGLICHTNNAMSWAAMSAGVVPPVDPVVDAMQFTAGLLRHDADVRALWGIPAGTVFCGGGSSFPGPRAPLNASAFPIDSQRVCDALAALDPGHPVIAPLPGQIITMVDGRVTDTATRARFVAVAPEAEWPARGCAAEVELLDDYLPASGRDRLTADEVDELRGHLSQLARFLYGRDQFRQLYSRHEVGADGRRNALALVLRGADGAHVLEYSPQACDFVDSACDDPVAELASGIEVWGTDLLAACRGELAPSMLVFGRARYWNFRPEELRIDVVPLMVFFHPLSRPEAFYALYRSLLGRAATAPVIPAARRAPTARAVARATPAEVRTAGRVRDRQVVTVIDDFYDDPMAVRELALAASYRRESGYPAPGTIARADLDVTAARDRIADILGVRLRASQSALWNTFRMQLAGDRHNVEAGARIHAHAGLGWVGLIYLTLPEHCRGGTAFYRHRATQLSDLSDPGSVEATLAARGWSFAELVERLDAEGNLLSEWDHLFTIPMKFNRLVIFRGGLFHGLGALFGTEAANARLTQNLAFDPA